MWVRETDREEEQEILGLGKQMHVAGEVKGECVLMWKREKNQFNLVIGEQYLGAIQLWTK